MTTVEIANKIGVSRATVSRVLNNHPNVKEETRQMVLAALYEYGYTPNETARSLVMKKSHRIAVVVFSEPEFFWKQVECGVTAAFNELKTFGVTVDYFVTNILKPLEQRDLIRSLPDKGYNGIAIAPNLPQLLSEEIDKISGMGVPVVIINAEIPSANHLCYIGCDYIQSGILAAEILAKSMNKQGKIAVLALRDQVISIEQRITGFRKELSRYDCISISQILRFDRKAQGVYDGVCAILKSSSDIQGIYVSVGALEQTAQAVLDSDLEAKISVVGYDLNQNIYNYLKKNAITATICHEPFSQGYLSVKILYRYLNYGTVPNSSIVYNKLEAIFASNAKYYMDEHMQFNMFYH